MYTSFSSHFRFISSSPSFGFMSDLSWLGLGFGYGYGEIFGFSGIWVFLSSSSYNCDNIKVNKNIINAFLMKKIVH